MARTALILGVTGQDGSLLAARLLDQGWRVYGTFRRGGAGRLWRLDELGIAERITLVNANLYEPHLIIEAIGTIKPDHIYHLAGESFVADSFEQPRSVLETNVLGTLNVLEAVRIAARDARLFFASSAEIFGRPAPDGLLNENSPRHPANPYAVSKLTAQNLATVYRERHGLHAVCGIMFNHEGPMRGRNFVTRKISHTLARLRLEGGPPMQLGAFDAARDWGSAADYVAAQAMTLTLDTPQDFVFATGRQTRVEDFLRLAAEAAGFDPAFDGDGLSATCRDRTSGRLIAVVAPRYLRRFDTPPLIGDPSKLIQATGFQGSRQIAVVAEEMVRADIDRYKQGLTNI